MASVVVSVTFKRCMKAYAMRPRPNEVFIWSNLTWAQFKPWAHPAAPVGLLFVGIQTSSIRQEVAAHHELRCSEVHKRLDVQGSLSGEELDAMTTRLYLQVRGQLLHVFVVFNACIMS